HRDSRGMARALSGDFTGAVRDFGAFTAWCAHEQTKRIGFEARQTFESEVAERNRWMAVLRAGRNPLTGDVIATLRKR
ncbi:MAG TPA: hypothetical protein VNG89_16795, partial [Vicinamibacterales bacterium]|nr:hypothetical protein [Vicinamibacterales bacterium]